MQQPCASCGIIIQTGEKIRMEVEAIYKQIPSAVYFGLHKNTIEYISSTIRHAKCLKEL